jgi:Calpain family cysteine protease
MVSKIAPRLTAALTDKLVTKEEAEQIVSTAKTERKWTPQLQAELSTFVAKHASKLEPQAKVVLEQFLATAHPKVDLADPALQKADRTSVTWTPVAADATLYVDTLSADDVAQGYIGDCYLASGLSSLASANPEVLRKAVTNNQDGTYTVRFYEGVEDGHRKAVSITVDDDVAMGKSGPQYAAARDTKELWPGLIEKAYAKWKGGYEKIGNGGNASDLFECLSGKKATGFGVTDYKPDVLFTKLTQAVKAHRPVAAGTFAEDAPNVNYTNTGVHGDHFYTVLATSVEAGTKYVQLRNPWGFSEPTGDGKDDGIFKLPLADFVKLYENVELGG